METLQYTQSCELTCSHARECQLHSISLSHRNSREVYNLLTRTSGVMGPSARGSRSVHNTAPKAQQGAYNLQDAVSDALATAATKTMQARLAAFLLGVSLSQAATLTVNSGEKCHPVALPPSCIIIDAPHHTLPKVCTELALIGTGSQENPRS